MHDHKLTQNLGNIFNKNKYPTDNIMHMKSDIKDIHSVNLFY